MMDDRKQRLGEHAAKTRPAWAVTRARPGPRRTRPPGRDGSGRRPRSAAYREMYGYDHPGDPIGPEPARTPPTSGPPGTKPSSPSAPPTALTSAAMPDGRLWLIRDTYTAETAWAPRHVGKELRLARLGASTPTGRHPRRRRSRRRPQGRRPRPGRAARVPGRQLPGDARPLPAREQTFAQTMADRPEWEHATADPPPGHRRRRRTAPPPPRSEGRPAALRRTRPGQRHEREQLQPAPDGKPGEIAAWIRDPAMQHHVSRAGIDNARS